MVDEFSIGKKKFVKMRMFRFIGTGSIETGLLKNSETHKKNMIQYKKRIYGPYKTYNNRLQLGMYEKEEWLYRLMMGKQ